MKTLILFLALSASAIASDGVMLKICPTPPADAVRAESVPFAPAQPENKRSKRIAKAVIVCAAVGITVTIAIGHKPKTAKTKNVTVKFYAK